MKRVFLVVPDRKLLAQLIKYTLQLFHEYITLNGKKGRIQRDPAAKERSAGIKNNLSLAPRHARSINHIQGKNLPSKFCATAREARGSCSSQVLERESREGTLSRRRAVGGRGERKRRKAREALLGVIVVYRFSKSFYSVFFTSPSLLFFLSATSSFPSPPPPPSISSAAFLSPSAWRTSYMPRSGYKISRTYMQDGSDWPGLKPSQITP